ncbi:MAG: AtpZ/AtpI family protein [Longimicrobiales bacterium]
MPERSSKERLAADAGRYLGLGLSLALSVLLFLLGGWAVDRWLGTMPLFLIIGAFVGAGAGFYSLYYHLVVEPRERERRARERSPDEPSS